MIVLVTNENGKRVPPSSHVSSITIQFSGESGISGDNEAHTEGVADIAEGPYLKDTLKQAVQCVGEDQTGPQAIEVSKIRKEEDGPRIPRFSPSQISPTIETPSESENLVDDHIAEFAEIADHKVKVNQVLDCIQRVYHHAAEILPVAKDESGPRTSPSTPVYTQASTRIESLGWADNSPEADAGEFAVAAENAVLKCTVTHTLESTGAEPQTAKISTVRKDETGRQISLTCSVSKRDPQFESPGAPATVAQAQVEDDLEVVPITTPRLERKITVKEMVLWFSNTHKAVKLPELPDDVTDNKSMTESRAISRIRSLKLADPTQAKHENVRAVEVNASQCIRRISSRQLHSRALEDPQCGSDLLAPAKRELQQLGVEIEACRPDNAGHHGGVRETIVLERTLRTINHGGHMHLNRALKYNQNLLDLQRKFERISSRLHKAKTDLATVKHNVKDYIRRRCRCWWCRGCTRLQKGCTGLRHYLPLMRLSTIAYQLKEKKRSRVEQRDKKRSRAEQRTRRSDEQVFTLNLGCVYVTIGNTGPVDG